MMERSIIDEWLEEERREAYEIGLKEGRQKVRIDAAKAMLKEDIAIDVIVKITKFTNEEVEKLQKDGV